jgi:hypothetical protein
VRTASPRARARFYTVKPDKGAEFGETVRSGAVFWRILLAQRGPAGVGLPRSGGRGVHIPSGDPVSQYLSAWFGHLGPVSPLTGDWRTRLRKLEKRKPQLEMAEAYGLAQVTPL